MKNVDGFIGLHVLVYDSRVWEKRKRDLGENEDCWREAVILRLRGVCGCQSLVDVKFLDGCVSPGHFLRAVKCLGCGQDGCLKGCDPVLRRVFS